MRARGGAIVVLALLVLVAVPWESEAESSAESKGSDWFGTSATDGTIWTWNGAPPTGAWRLQYIHWFRVPPATWNWLTEYVIPKPATPDDWPTVIAGFDAAKETQSPAGSLDRSEWHLRFYRGDGFVTGGYWVLPWTKSYAWCAPADRRAGSKTRITDPWILEKPAGMNEWMAVGFVTLLGKLAPNPDGGTARVDSLYRIGIDTTDDALATDLFSVSIATSGAGGTVTGAVDVAVWDANLKFFDVLGNEITPAEVASAFEPYFTSQGYDSIAAFPGEFDPASHDPGYYPSILVGYPLTADASFVAIFTDARSEAEDPAAPTAIELVSFTATSEGRAIRLDWETATETDTAGFRLWRADAEDGAYASITAALIPGEGSPTGGASYSFVDGSVSVGKTYWYKLEDVDLHGNSTFHGPASATVARNPFFGCGTSTPEGGAAGLVLLIVGAAIGFRAVRRA